LFLGCKEKNAFLLFAKRHKRFAANGEKRLKVMIISGIPIGISVQIQWNTGMVQKVRKIQDWEN